jgi:diguanylate cyclase (GGDEF)-like protein/PAS domain S-box-containing protein
VTRVLPRLRLRAKLLLVLIAPVAGLATFSASWAEHLNGQAAQAEERRERTELVVVMGDLLFDVRLDAALTVAYENAAFVEQALSSAPGRMMSNNLHSARAAIPVLADRMEAERRRIGAAEVDWTALRRLLERVAGAPARIERLPHDDSPARRRALGAILRGHDAAADALVAAMTQVSGSATGGATREAGDLAALPGVVSAQGAAADEAVLLLETAHHRDFTPANARALERLAERWHTALRVLQPHLPTDLERRVARFLTSPAEREWTRLHDRVVTGHEIPMLKGALLAQVRMIELTGIREALAGALRAGARAEAAAARRDRAILLIAGGALSLLGLGLAAGVGRSTIRTLQRLERRAGDIEAGNLDLEPLAIPGRDETATLARTFDRMTETLRLVRAQVQALAEGRTGDAGLTAEPPGEIGASLQRSMRRLSEVTERLRTSERFARLIVDTAAEGVWTLDARHRVIFANRAACELAGLEREAMRSRRITDLIALPPAAGAGARALAEVTSLEVEIVRPGGDRVPALVSVRHLPDVAEDGIWTVFARDISDRRTLEHRLEHQATHDPLTDLPNRTAIIERLEAELARVAHDGRGFGVLFIDLDRFKVVNDALGHQSGDALLTLVAERLRGQVRADDVVGRLGGDEFVVVTAGSPDAASVETLARRILDALREPYDLFGTPAHVSASVGIVWQEDGRPQATELIRDADIAMYQAKQRGNGGIAVYDDAMRQRLSELDDMARDLRSASGSGGLRPQFQPIVDLADGGVRGVELLARWSREGVEVPPAVFVQVAEEAGLVGHLGRWALREACDRIVAWQARHPGRDLSVSVNISGLHAAREDLLGDVKAALARSGADPRLLRVEITESHVIHEEDGALEALRRLREMGVGVSIDDFGTGYSSLMYLRRLPADEVKIDRSLVSRLGENPAEDAVVSSVAALALSLGLRPVAEGVETAAQREALRQLGCHIGQGYLFSGPLDEDALHDFLDRGPGGAAPGDPPPTDLAAALG